MAVFDEIRVRMGNSYMTLSQLRRLVDGITNHDNVRPWSNTSRPRLSFQVSQPLIFDDLTASNATPVTVTSTKTVDSSLVLPSLSASRSK
jgi:hypothetical protein